MYARHQRAELGCGVEEKVRTDISCRGGKLAQPFLHVSLAKVREPFEEGIIGHGRDVQFASEEVAQRGPVAGGKVRREGLI